MLGAVTVTAATGSFIYGILNAGDTGWADLGTLPAIAAGASLMLVAAGVLIAGLFPGSQLCSVPASWPCASARPGSPRQAAARAGGARWELPVPGGIRTRRLRMRARATTATAWGAPP